MVGALASHEVYVYRRTPTGWVQTQRLRGPESSQFGGTDIDIDEVGTTAVIGAPGWGWPVPIGRAEVFELQGDEWVWTAELSVPGLLEKDWFGGEVEISGDMIAVAAGGIDDPHPGSGRIFIFERQAGGWTRTASLLSGVDDLGNIGVGMDFHGTTLATRCFTWDDKGDWDLHTGAVLILERRSTGAWERTAYLPEPEPQGEDLDGYPSQIALSPDSSILAVGDRGNPASWGYVPGEVYLWERDASGEWQYANRLRASDPPGEDDDFGGHAIEIEGNRVLVGDGEANGDGDREGAVYVFERQGTGQWPNVETRQLVVSDDDQNIFSYGYELAVDRGFVFVGNQPGTAGVYLYELTVGEVFCPSAVNSTGEAAKLNAVGSDTIANNALAFSARQCPSDSWGLLLMSPKRISAVPHQDGWLCLGRPVARLGRPLPTGATGTAIRTEDLTQPPLSQAILPGTTWNFQFWYADPLPVGGLGNLTNAVSITFK